MLSAPPNEQHIALNAILPSLHAFIKAEDIAKLKQLLAEHGKTIIDQRTLNSNAPLHTAVLAAKPDYVILLIQAGAPLDSLNDDGCTPLLLAIRSEQTDIALSLIKAGADCNLADKKGSTPLYEAIAKKEIAMIHALLAKWATITDAEKRLANEKSVMINRILIRTDIFRRLFLCLDNFFRYAAIFKDENYAAVLEYFQHICFQLGMMQAPIQPEGKTKKDYYHDESTIRDAETIRHEINQLSDEERKRGTVEFMTALKARDHYPAARPLYSALSKNNPPSKFFSPILCFELTESYISDLFNNETSAPDYASR